MAAPRTTSLRALRSLTHTPKPTPNRRTLHMTGPATYASPTLTQQPPKITPSLLKPAPVQNRDFNTSPTNNTIDNAALPVPTSPDTGETFMVPLITTTSTPASILAVEPEEVEVLKPEISSMSADAVFLPMSDFAASHAADVEMDLGVLTAELRKVPEKVEEGAGMVGRIWGDLVEDFLGGGRKVVA